MEWQLHLPPAPRAEAATAAAAAAAAASSYAGGVTLDREEYVLGVDEAGRGPVLGPMVYAAAFWPKREQDRLARAGFDDSKKLSEADRERLFQELRRDPAVGYAVCSISARELSRQMLRASPVSLNKVAHDATVEMLSRVLRAGVAVREVYVDAVGDSDSYARVLSAAIPQCKFTVCPKADSLFKCVSAASIVAKVTRDAQLRDWVFEERGPGARESKDWGCGYPGDEKTKRWLADNVDPVFGFPSVVRMSWATARTILEGRPPSAAAPSLAKSEGDADADASASAAEDTGVEARGARVTFPCDVTRPGSQSITSMFSRASNKRVHYFSARGMDSLPFAESLR